jgi:hypothetical protein
MTASVATRVPLGRSARACRTFRHSIPRAVWLRTGKTPTSPPYPVFLIVPGHMRSRNTRACTVSQSGPASRRFGADWLALSQRRGNCERWDAQGRLHSSHPLHPMTHPRTRPLHGSKIRSSARPEDPLRPGAASRQKSERGFETHRRNPEDVTGHVVRDVGTSIR